MFILYSVYIISIRLYDNKSQRNIRGNYNLMLIPQRALTVLFTEIHHPSGQKAATQRKNYFRVKAPVARHPPHRSGREDFPHPVPQLSIISYRQTVQATPRSAHNFRHCKLFMRFPEVALKRFVTSMYLPLFRISFVMLGFSFPTVGRLSIASPPQK